MTISETPTPCRARAASRPDGRRRITRTAAAAITVVVVAAGLSACTPPADSGPTSGATLSAVGETTGITPGTQLTVNGTGYNPAANIGTRPPLWNVPAGVYVVFACVTGDWRPSAGPGAGTRQVIQQFWAVPGQSQFDTIGGAAAGAVLMDQTGAFSVSVTATPNDCAGRYAVITYPGSGAAVNAGEELELPVTFASAT